MKKIFNRIILRLRHWFHIISNVHPCVWMALYLVLIPIFALLYYWLPTGEFRIPDNGGTNYGSWLYYSTVTITTLGFGDYTPAHGLAQAITAVEVMCGLLCMGFFLNSVGAIKSEVDMESAIEKQRQLHEAQEKAKLAKHAPVLCHVLNAFIRECQEATSQGAKTLSLLPQLTKAAARASLSLDSFQNRVDLTIWPDLMENCFAFVANYQILSSDISTSAHLDEIPDQTSELNNFIQENTTLADKIESQLNSIVAQKDDN